MLSLLFRKMVDFSPKLSLWGWKYFYELTARVYRKKVSWKFMNYGYAEKEEETTDYDVLCGKLYHHLAGQIPISGNSRLLEVGCGRGGGSELLLNYQPQSVTGLDFSKNVIGFCLQQYSSSGLSFITGNAERLPFKDHTFDVIFNIESSHCYGNRTAFFNEVHRCLKPGGYFLYADFMSRIYYPKRVKLIKESGFDIINEEDITSRVIRSMQLSSEYKKNLIKKLHIPVLKKAIADFAGLPESDTYQRFEKGELIYFSFICQNKLTDPLL